MKGQTSTSALKRFMNKDNTVGHVFAFPFIFGFVCFSLIPVCISFYYAFTNYSLGSKTAAFIGFKNFLRLFQDEVFLKSLAITLKYVLISVPLKLTFALLVAYLLTRPSRMVTFYRSLYYLPSLVGGSVAVALVWKQLFARKGLFNSVLANMDMSTINWFGNQKLALYPLILMSVWQFGSSMIIFAAGLKEIPVSYYEAARIDGARGYQSFFRITLPCLSPIILYNLIMQTISAFMAFTQAMIITNGGPKYDTGEDHAMRYADAPDPWEEETPPQGCTAVPIASMDVMSYSYACRETLAEIARISGDAEAQAQWAAKAKAVQDKMVSYLWDDARGAMFDRDKNHNQMPTLIHNTLRCMYWHSLPDALAERFVKEHLLNPQEFWTKMPLPSVAANDPLFRNVTTNNWSGQAEALTYQRAIRALENYGMYELVPQLGQKLMQAIGLQCRFVQQYDPFTGEPSVICEPGQPPQDAYGPAMLSVLEYTARMYGVSLVRDTVVWGTCPLECRYTQALNGRSWEIVNSGHEAEAFVDGCKVFTAGPGLRITTDLDGNILGTARYLPDADPAQVTPQ